jgi:hypothetical protein
MISTCLLNIYKNDKIYQFDNFGKENIEYKLIFKSNENIYLQFKLYTFKISYIEFKHDGIKKKITNIHPDGFLFSYVFEKKDVEIIFYPLEQDSQFTIKKIITTSYDINLTHKHKIFWDNIYIINLKKRIDRKKNMIKQLQKASIQKYEFIEAIDGMDFNILNNYKKLVQSNKCNIVTVGHFACLLSHIKAIKMAKQMGYSNIMILEDDVFFCHDFINLIETLNVPEYQMIYLGGIIKKKKIFLNKWVISNKIMGAYGYILTSELFDVVLNGLEKLTEYVDIFYMINIQPCYKVLLLDDFVKTNLDSSDTSAKSSILTRRLSYIKN